MNFNYNDLLREKIYELQRTLGDNFAFKFEIDSEQSFLKRKDLEPETIYILTKDLQNDNSIGVDTQPVQILILTEQNSLDTTKFFFSELAKKYNFEAISKTINGTNIWVKQQYSDPVVLSNFNAVDYGYRSIMYMSATLYIMYNVVDIKELTIDGVAITPLASSLSYSSSMNTQQFFTRYIAQSVKSISTLSLTITVPVVASDFITKIVNIMGEQTGYTGNEDFAVSFKLSGVTFNVNMKLVSTQFTTAPNQVPSMVIGMML